MSFERFLAVIKELDPVKAGTVNRPIRQVDQNVRYLWDVLQAAGTGATVYARRKAVEAEAVRGMAVYFNPATAQFERGLAVMDTSQAGGILRPAASSQIWGIVANKINDTLADILLYGYDAVDIAPATGGTVTAGAYYLSGTSPGRLVQQKNPVSVMVLRAAGDGTVFVQPQFVDFLDRHVHYQFALACRPAGSHVPPAPGQRHVIINPDSDRRGWLPADHPIFEGKAPPQAVWGYNRHLDDDLNAAWPPIPATQAYLEFDRGIDATVGGTGVPLGPEGLAIIDRNGIWWTSDSYGDVPWPTDFDTTDTGSSLSLSDSGGEDPRALHMTMTLWFTRLNFATDTTVVTSLRAKDNRIVITCRDTTTAATAGDLDIDLNLNLVVATDKIGYTAIKTFNPDTTTFESGPVVEGLYTTGDNVILSGDVSRALNPDDPSSPTLHQGKVLITVLPASTLELDTQLIRLDGAEEDFLTDPPVMFVAFRAAEESEIRGRINVPVTLGLTSPQLKLRFLTLGKTPGTLPDLIITARRLPRPTNGLTTPENLPLAAAEFAVTCDFSSVLASANQYVEVESEAFVVAAGDTVFYTVKRLATDGYAGDVGLIRQTGVVTAGS